MTGFTRINKGFYRAAAVPLVTKCKSSLRPPSPCRAGVADSGVSKRGGAVLMPVVASSCSQRDHDAIVKQQLLSMVGINFH